MKPTDIKILDDYPYKIPGLIIQSFSWKTGLFHEIK